MRRFLYSKWYFLLLAFVSFVNLAADLADEIWGWNFLNRIAIGMDVVTLGLALWIFADLHSRRPKRVDDSRGRG